jgi:hypothetical protein
LSGQGAWWAGMAAQLSTGRPGASRLTVPGTRAIALANRPRLAHEPRCTPKKSSGKRGQVAWRDVCLVLCAEEPCH